MKTQYFHRPRRFLSPGQSILLALGIGVVLLLIAIRFFAPGFFTTLASPFWSFGTFASTAFSERTTANTASERIQELQRENESLVNENRALLDRLGEDEYTHIGQGIVAGVIARPPLSPYDVLIVSAGTEQGVFQGMHVFSKNIPIGTVESIAGNSARIALYSVPGRKSEGWVGEARIPVTIIGGGAGTFETDVAHDAPIQEGDLVYVPGPGALPIGTVVQIESHPSSPRSVLHIRPFANPFTMTVVRIVPFPSL